MANILSQLCYVKCGDIFFASQTTRDDGNVKLQRHQHIYLSIRQTCTLQKKMMRKPIMLLQRDHWNTDLIPNTRFFTLPVAFDCNPDSSTRSVCNYWISILLPILSQPKHTWNAEFYKGLVWVRYNTRRACYVSDPWSIWYLALGQQYEWSISFFKV